jgi:hypothetical protein
LRGAQALLFLTAIARCDRTLGVGPFCAPIFTQAQRQQVDAWVGQQLRHVPEPVATFLKLHRRYLSAEAEHAVARRFKETVSELRRAMGITASSERRRSKNPLATVPLRETKTTLTARERLEQQHRVSAVSSRRRAIRHRDHLLDLFGREARRYAGQPPSTNRGHGFGELDKLAGCRRAPVIAATRHNPGRGITCESECCAPRS